MRLLLLIPLALLGCEREEDRFAEARALIAEHGCAGCHVIPEVPGADGLTGPPLNFMHRQVYVAGVVPNTREALAAFIMDPQAIDPRSAMPDLGITPEGAREIAEFLYAAGEGL